MKPGRWRLSYMKIKSSRLFLHPVLSSMYDDYYNSKFEIIVKAYKKVKKICLSIKCHLENAELLKLINSGYVEIVCHFECQKTKLRYIEKLEIGENFFEIPSANLNENLQIIAFIVSKKQILNFYSNDFNNDYADIKFSIEPGSILAISNQPDIPIVKDIYDLSSVPSIISIVPYNSDSNHKISIDMDNDKIMVRLQKQEYQKYAELSKGISDFTPILHSIIIIPALTYVFDILKGDEETFHSYASRRWFKVLQKKFISMDKKLEFSELQNLDSLYIAQEIIESPIVDSLTNLLVLGGN